MPAPASLFQVARLTREGTGAVVDVSHLIDRTYDYHSDRELRWHLAERFNLPVHKVALRRH